MEFFYQIEPNLIRDMQITFNIYGATKKDRFLQMIEQVVLKKYALPNWINAHCFLKGLDPVSIQTSFHSLITL